MFLFFKVVAKTKRPSFSDSLGTLATQLSNIGVNVEYTPLLLGSFLSPDPLVAILPKPQEKNLYCEEVVLPCVDWLDTIAKFPLRASKIPDLVARCYPDVSKEMLLAALVYPFQNET